MPVSPEELLAAAERLLTSLVPGLGSLWPQACALLIRLARGGPGSGLPAAATIGMRQQLLPAAKTSPAWRAGGVAGAGGGGDHHAYELAPTAAELRGWHSSVGRLWSDDSFATGRGRQPRPRGGRALGHGRRR